ncbi:MAG: ATP-dependent DNA helicase UvrD2 [Nocardioidaceae bacterium]
MPAADRLLEGLDPEQREVATALEGPVRVLAGAGTGKTRAITHRLAYAIATRAVEPTQILAVTFTTRAAGEMRSRLAGLGAAGVQSRTFHSAALRQARYFWPEVYGSQLPEIASSKVPLLAEAVGRLRLKASQPDLRDLAGEIEWAKVSNVQPDDYARLAARFSRQLASYDAATIAKVFASYEEVRRDRNRIDMEDVLLCAAALLAQDERVTAAVHRQYSWFVVDEFQDVSPLQSRLLDLWVGGRDSVCVVGDPAQTIYSFAGASADYLIDFPRRYPQTTSVTLRRNYRSTPQVVDAANAVMAATSDADVPAENTRAAAVRLVPIREAGTQVTFSAHPDEVAEATAVASSIADSVAAGADPRHIAVLFRINAQSESFEEALAERSVPYVVRGGDRFFGRAEVRQAVALLRGAARSEAAVTGDLVADVTDVLTAMGWTREPPRARGNVRDRWESLQAIVAMAVDHAAANADRTIGDFVAELQRRGDTQHAPVADGVTLTTLHAAKGLEWSTVYLAGMHDGSMPIVYAETAEQVAEERRLLYVGMTRARDVLRVSWAAARSPGGRGQRGPSRFLDPLVSPGLRAAPTAGPGRRGRRAPTVASCRVCTRPLTDARERKLGRCADCPSSYDEALYDALRAWRKERAAAEKVPAYCVFTDATLTALAEMRPTDGAGLVAVPGIGATKVEKYGDEVLALCGADGGGAAGPTA